MLEKEQCGMLTTRVFSELQIDILKSGVQQNIFFSKFWIIIRVYQS